MTDTESTLRQEIVRIGRLLYERGLIVAGEGNLSARLNHEAIITTPSGGCKGMLDPAELVVVDLEGQAQGGGRPSSELQMHLAVYQQRPDVQGVVHAHPPIAVACTLAGVRLDDCVLPEQMLTL